jgi:hypothetical protein
MMPGQEGTPLTADEYLMFNYIADHASYREPRTQISLALMQVRHPQSEYVQDAWQERAREMWV